MASIIKLKRSLTSTSVPGSLQEGELAANIEDKKLFIGGKNGGANVQTISGDQYNLTSTNGSDSATITLTVDNNTLSNDAITIAGGEGVDVSESGGTITLAGEDASTTNKGIASFNSTYFSTSSGAVSVKTGGIDTTELAADAVTGAKIADNAIDSEHITSGAIDATHLAADIVDGTKIANNAIDSEHITSGSIDTAHIANKQVTAAKIADGTITATQISAGGLTANTIGNNSVALGTKTTGNYVATVSGSGGVSVSGSGSETATVAISLDDNISANTSGNAATATLAASATALSTGRTIGMTGDVVWTSSSFDGSGNVTGTATIQPNSVALGTDTTGNYVATVSGTSNEIEVSGSGSENAGVTVGLPNDVTISNNLTVSGAASVAGNVTIDGNLTVEGATTYVSSSTVNVDDSAIKLSANNSGDTVDQGMYGKYVVGGTSKYSGWHRDASDSGIIKWYKDLTTEPTTTVDASHASYALAQMDAIIDGGTY